MQKRLPTNPELLNTVSYLRRASRHSQTPLWNAVAGYLSKSRRSRVTINLGQVSRHVKEGQMVVVPGKVLSSGDPHPKLTIAAFKFSPGTVVKVEKAGGRCISLQKMVEENPRGTNVRLLC